MSKAFWKEAVVYQIYPRSFMDGNGDGIGDLQGIISRLDYLRDLGIDVVWLGPVYRSPNADNGYDISDYRAIMAEFGTMDDWDLLLEGLHERGIRLVMDLVVNHTSDEHEWFSQSRRSKDNPYRDYYYWRPGKDGAEPNNWASAFGGSAWQYDEQTDEYYLHLFSAKQPDLNWDNPKVRQDIYAMMKWWLDKGVDGFRMDVINFISKAPELPQAPAAEGQRYAWGGQYFMNGPRIHEFLREMNEQALTPGRSIMTIGEMPGVSPEEALLYVGEERKELNMVFQFELMDIDAEGDKWNIRPWKLTEFKRIMDKWQTSLQGKGWNSLYLNNHDQPRMVSRFGNDGRYRVESAKMLATMLHTLQGTPFIYQGEEIGMTNVKFSSIEDYRDVETMNLYRDRVIEGGQDADGVMKSIYAKGRDNARTPMQWDDGGNAGFTCGKPWIGVNPNYREINVKQSLEDPLSILYYYRKLIRLRREHSVLVYGDYRMILDDHEQIYAYMRTLGALRWLVMLNFFESEAEFVLPEEIDYSGKRLVLGNYPADPGADIRRIRLRPYEARVYELE
ncbi:glycoside hydrolase family 13 protein [Ferviditalea candida]|uniref:oligo-1,6-glucosidase n=1 Tax=Ferviditalea candida TaxID=3108399 RepID=A0ABU5ZEE2_9BACL|nr:alpha-glucosidase [Paenibacillaceae bacterium T2]